MDQYSKQDQNIPEASFNDNTGTGRSYECNFCKRGFTNAQALGGHMNIHRKEKAKASNKQSINISHGTSFSNPFINDQENNISTSRWSQATYNNNHQFYFPLPNPSDHPDPYACYQSGFSTVENLGANLSLGTGSWRSTKDDEVIKKDLNARDEKMENEVDLELRLGHDP